MTGWDFGGLDRKPVACTGLRASNPNHEAKTRKGSKVKLKLALVATTALALGGVADAQAEKLTGFNAWSKVVGNTVKATVDGKQMEEYYNSNGTLKHLEGGSKISAGKWVLEGANVCLTYAPGNEKECYVIEVDGDIATFTSKTHGGFRATIVQGNPNKL